MIRPSSRNHVDVHYIATSAQMRYTLLKKQGLCYILNWDSRKSRKRILLARTNDARESI